MNIAIVEWNCAASRSSTARTLQTTRHSHADALRVCKLLGTRAALLLMKMIGDENEAVERLFRRRANADAIGRADYFRSPRSKFRSTPANWCACRLCVSGDFKQPSAQVSVDRLFDC